MQNIDAAIRKWAPVGVGALFFFVFIYYRFCASLRPLSRTLAPTLRLTRSCVLLLQGESASTALPLGPSFVAAFCLSRSSPYSVITLQLHIPLRELSRALLRAGALHLTFSALKRMRTRRTRCANDEGTADRGAESPSLCYISSLTPK